MKYWILSLILAVCGILATHDAVYKIHSYEQILHAFDACDQNTLIVFDIDGTLIEQSGGMSVLIEPIVVDIIKKLKEKGCTVIAITAVMSGFHPKVGSIPIWRYHDLKNLGITFSQHLENAEFSHLPPCLDNFPVIYNGIACSNMVEKGFILEAIIQRYQLHPTHLLFFDDLLVNHRSIGATCNQLNIPCDLFWYRRASSNNAPVQLIPLSHA